MCLLTKIISFFMSIALALTGWIGAVREGVLDYHLKESRLKRWPIPTARRTI